MHILTCRKPPAAPPWMEAAPSGVGAPAWPVLEKKDVKEPCFPKKFLHSMQMAASRFDHPPILRTLTEHTTVH